ncbi:sulfatase family protein [Clostridium tarantellae]|uniref:Sulfatase-like hydrolase/transferase n=1 Tax=Clostridium tarantellae TaxID=39493 RepID=A0A6I1MM80_9CLOT|nr:sulfatase-like hydrolase/transferase [Clostridium tarantellae]MPQ44090.1 sulfatase-like hydrolase/transferase [Clostridium tarantellae]
MDKSPNILLITSDQQHWNTIGKFNKEIKTPNLDRLCNEGTIFTRYYCTNPTCTPSRASIITGKYPSQHGAWSLGTKLPENELTLAKYLKNKNYETALIGKAHFQPLKSTEEYHSLEAYPILQDLEFWEKYKEPFYGFNYYELARNHTNEAHIGQHYALWLEKKGCLNWREYFLTPTGNMDKNIYKRIERIANEKDGFEKCKRNWGKWNIPEEYHYNNWIAEKTNIKLEEYSKKEKSFFLWSSFFDPHPEYFVPEPWASMYSPDDITLPQAINGEHEKNPPHFKMTQEKEPDFSKYNNSGLGVHGFHSHLQKKEDIKKDIAIYYGMISMMDCYIGKILDKLEQLGLEKNTIIIFTSDHGHFYGQHGLIRKGPFHYEDMIKVPFIVRYDNRIPKGEINTSLQSLVDLAPTLLSFLQHEIPREMTGINQKEVWCGEKKKVREHIIVENRHEDKTMNLRTFVDNRYKITIYYGKTYGELFDLQKDPNEINNLWDDENYKDLKMKLLLKYIWAELDKEPMWMPRITHA